MNGDPPARPISPVERRAHPMRAQARAMGVAAMPYAFAIAGLIVAAVTFLSITGIGPIGPASPWMIALLGINFVLVFLIASLLARQLWTIFRRWRQPESGARLKLRFAALFGFAAVAPAAIVAAFLSLTLFRSIEAWFDARVSTIVDKSVVAAQAYVRETVETLRSETLAMAEDVNNARANAANPDELAVYLRTQAIYRSFSAAYLIDGAGRPLIRAESESAPKFAPPNAATLANARSGQVAARPEEDANIVRAVYRLSGTPETFLYVIRYVDGSIWRQLRVAQDRVSEYRAAEARQGRLRSIFFFAYLQTASLIFFAATWIGLSAADSIVGPIGRLADAARRVQDGDLSARVHARAGGDEVEALARAFNGMTERLESQREALIRARSEAESRSRFIEMVLAGASSGVVGLDGEGRITLANRSAADLLQHPVEALIGRRLVEIAPELAMLVDAAQRTPHQPASGQIDIERKAEFLHFNVRIVSDQIGRGFVVTIDDMTRLVSAQRLAAWKDVARRIAHEIKNPLTPIQLSAERLKRRYAPSITSDRETFERCTDTILRQVGDIRRMVDEFSAFARMPAPEFAPHDLRDIAREAVFSQRLAFADLAFVFAEPFAPVIAECDARVIGQVLGNLLKNAAEALEARAEVAEQGRIEILFGPLHPEEVTILVRDNGPGFPVQDRRKLLEPYVSTRGRGSGLGLAIAKRAIEDHGGRIALEDAPRRAGPGAARPPGAQVRIVLPIVQPRPAARSAAE